MVDMHVSFVGKALLTGSARGGGRVGGFLGQCDAYVRRGMSIVSSSSPMIAEAKGTASVVDAECFCWMG
jgi:hypothetical protein